MDFLGQKVGQDMRKNEQIHGFPSCFYGYGPKNAIYTSYDFIVYIVETSCNAGENRAGNITLYRYAIYNRTRTLLYVLLRVGSSAFGWKSASRLKTFGC